MIPDTDIKLNPLHYIQGISKVTKEITIRASLRICQILHWYVKIYLSTPENLTSVTHI